MAKKTASPSDGELKKKWGADAYSLGWTAIPNIVIERQQTLKLDSLQLNLILILLKHWWRKDDAAPFPTKKTLGEITNRDPTTIQRKMRELEQKGYVTRQVRRTNGGGQQSNGYDLSGLITAVQKLSKEEKASRAKREREDAKKRRGVEPLAS